LHIAPAISLLDRLRTGAGRRAVGLGLTILIEVLLLLVLLTLGREQRPVEEERPTTIISIRAEDVPAPAPEDRPETEQRSETQPRTPQPRPDEPQPPQPAAPAAEAPPPVPPAIVPMDWQMRPANPMRSAERPAAPARVYGPPDVRSAMMRDTERVGTAPNGQPLYAAAWYREPSDAMMRAYLSGARGPGYGLIACRTAPDFRVEDCVALEEYPTGSNINRSILAAAWEFRVRPPRRGGQVLVGSWVRIRITYN